jgi:hypothetical protein
MRTFYESSTTEEEDRRRCRDCGDIAEDGVEPEGGTEASALDDAAIDVRWPLSLSRMRPAGLLQCRLSEEGERDPQSARSWRWRTGQAGGDF